MGVPMHVPTVIEFLASVLARVSLNDGEEALTYKTHFRISFAVDLGVPPWAMRLSGQVCRMSYSMVNFEHSRFGAYHLGTSIHGIKLQ
jgi:hypothetical protein